MKTFKYILYITIFAIGSISITSCNDDEGTSNPTSQPNGTADLTIHFENQYNMETLVLGNKYVTTSGDSIQIDVLRYWISNIKLYNGTELAWSDENSYYLIEKTASNVREMIALKEIPVGKYTAIEFALGVDSTANAALENKAGELDETDGMAWNWNTGYKFLRMDGSYYNTDSASYETLRVHTGLNAYYLQKKVEFGQELVLTKEGSHEAHMMVMLNNMFDSPNQLDVKSKEGIWMFFAPDPSWNQINENIASMFMLHHAE